MIVSLTIDDSPVVGARAGLAVRPGIGKRDAHRGRVVLAVALTKRREQPMLSHRVIDAKHQRRRRAGPRARMDEVLRGVVVGRQGIVLQDGFGNRIDPIGGDHISRKRITHEAAGRVRPRRLRIVNRDQLAVARAGLGEITRPLSNGGHGSYEVVRRLAVRSLDVHEKECAVPPDGAAGREAGTA